MLGEAVDLCTKKLIFDTPRRQRCAYVNVHCQDKYEFNDYYGWYFCSFDQNWILISIICLFALFIQIRTLEYTSDGFISQAIGKIAGYLKLTEAMAGATLLAFSNGATDVITILVASGSSESDDLAVGALFGASTFAVTIILASVIWVRPGNLIDDLKRGNLVRDITTYLIAVATFIAFGFYNSQYWIIGTILISIYLVYVFVVWLEERNKESSIGQRKEIEDVLRQTFAHHITVLEHEHEHQENLHHHNHHIENKGPLPKIVINPATSEMDSMAQSEELGGLPLASKLGSETATLEQLDKNPMENGNEDNRLTVPLAENQDDQLRISTNSSIVLEGEVLDLDFFKAEKRGHLGKIFYKAKKKIVESWEELSLVWKCVYIIEAPIKFLV